MNAKAKEFVAAVEAKHPALFAAQRLSITTASLREQLGWAFEQGQRAAPRAKEYKLNREPNGGASPAGSVGLYWQLWTRLHKLKPKLSRHALTKRALGYSPRVDKMTEGELTQVCAVFSAIIRDAGGAQ